MFSVIIPLYNKAPYVRRAIDSVLTQTFSEYEIIVVNDGSTDGGEEIVEKEFGDQIQLVSQSNQGVSVARNTGILLAKFPWIAFLDADDYWNPSFLDHIKSGLEQYPDIKMIGTSYSNLSISTGKESFKTDLITDYFKVADHNTLFTSSSTVIHRSFFESNSGFKPELVFGEDVDVWFRVFSWFGKAAYIPVPLMYYDLGASSSTKSVPILKRTIFAAMYKEDYELSSKSQSWVTFRDKYLLLNLFQFLTTNSNYREGKNLLRKKESAFLLATLPYYLPYIFFRIILGYPQTKKWLRIYLKFCFRYIYT